jgi:dATP/dGTP diphosphohydrolase
MGEDYWSAERSDVLRRFLEELATATGDGSKKRQAGEKPPWYEDMAHEAAIFSHITKWKRGELTDPDSGAHPLVHAAWRCLAIACREVGNVPGEGQI